MYNTYIQMISPFSHRATSLNESKRDKQALFTLRYEKRMQYQMEINKQKRKKERKKRQQKRTLYCVSAIRTKAYAVIQCCLSLMCWNNIGISRT